MAFRPGGPGFSGNASAGSAPPMMMFNPAQFSQLQAPQIPQPSPTPTNQIPQGNPAMPNNSNYQQGPASSHESGPGAFNQQQFQQHPGQYQQESHADSTSNAYQSAGVYQNYNSGGQIPQQPQSNGSNWNYGQENVQPAQQYQQHQSAEQFPNSMNQTYQQSQDPLYNSYSAQNGVTNNLPPKQPMYQNQLASFEQHPLDPQGTYSNSVHGQPNMPTNYMNDGPPQATTQTGQNSSKEPSVSHGSTEQSNFTNGTELQTNSVNHSIDPQMPPTNSFNSISNESVPKHGPNLNAYSENTGNISHQPPMWNPNDNVNYGQPPQAFESHVDTNAAAGSKQAQPDLVSAASSSTSPSTFQQPPPHPQGGASFHSASPEEQQHSENLSPENFSQIGSTNPSIAESHQQSSQFGADSSSWEHQEAPSSLPPLYNSYQQQPDPQSTVMSKGGYGLGPDVITAVSSSSIPQVPQSSVGQNLTNDNTNFVQNNTQEFSFEEEPQWGSNIIAEEANQATAKMASRIDEMRKAQEAAAPQHVTSGKSADEPVNALPTSSNIASEGKENLEMHPNLPTNTDSSVDTSPEHAALRNHQGNVPLGSHAEHYAYYQQFENLSTNNVISGNSQGNTSSGPMYNRTPDVIAAQQPAQHPGAPPSSDRNLYMQTGHLNEQDDVLSHEDQGYSREISSSSELSNQQQMFNQPTIHRPTTVPDGGNELPVTTSSTSRSETSERQVNDSAPDADIPLDRLVLGESGSASNQQLLANSQPQYPLQSNSTDHSAPNWNMWSNEQTNRVVTGEDDRRVPGAPSR